MYLQQRLRQGAGKCCAVLVGARVWHESGSCPLCWLISFRVYTHSAFSYLKTKTEGNRGGNASLPPHCSLPAHTRRASPTCCLAFISARSFLHPGTQNLAVALPLAQVGSDLPGVHFKMPACPSLALPDQHRTLDSPDHSSSLRPPPPSLGFKTLAAPISCPSPLSLLP